MYKILVPVDGSIHALKALHIACDLADKYDAQVVLLHVLVEGKTPASILEMLVANKLDAELQTLMERAVEKGVEAVPKKVLRVLGDKILHLSAAKVRRRGLDVVMLEIAEGDPVESILEAHVIAGAASIVMGSSGKSTDNGSPFGSVSQAVFERADCTCLAVK